MYKIKHKKEIETELRYIQTKDPKTIILNWKKVWDEAWCEKYLQNDEYAQWYDDWYQECVELAKRKPVFKGRK